MMRGNIILYV